MGNTIEALLRLQQVESQLANLRLAADRRKRQVKQCERKLSACQIGLDEKNAEIVQREIEVSSLELDIGSRDAATAKHREALTMVKTNKEYANILSAINTEKADTVKIENQVLQMMADIDKFKAESEALASRRVEATDQMEAAQSRLADHAAATAQEVARLETLREDAAVQVPPSALTGFTRIAAKNDGEAMAEVVKLHPKRNEYMCGACNMAITLEQINALMSRDDIQTCNNCGWILYLTQAVPAVK